MLVPMEPTFIHEGRQSHKETYQMAGGDNVDKKMNRVREIGSTEGKDLGKWVFYTEDLSDKLAFEQRPKEGKG